MQRFEYEFEFEFEVSDSESELVSEVEKELSPMLSDSLPSEEMLESLIFSMRMHILNSISRCGM